MSLPVELATLFRAKQKSYKMVLVLSIIDLWKEEGNTRLSLENVARRFLSYYTNRETSNLKTDTPPQQVVAKWADMTLAQLKSLLNTPIDALRSIVNKDDQAAILTFQDHIWATGTDVINELRKYALEELDSYNEQLQGGFSLKQSLDHILNTYTVAKTQPLTNHPLGTLIRRTIPDWLKELPFVTNSIRVQGSIGQGNWATVPWIALMDRRMTETTQHGEYLVYLFAEDMSAVYVTFNQGVTEPLRERGRREGYVYLQRKVNELREQLPLDHFTKDEHIQLTASGLGRDYQVSTVAYIRYDRGAIPDDDQLIADLENLMENYKLYVEAQLQVATTSEPVDTPPAFKFTMAHLKLGQGLIAFLGQRGDSERNAVQMDELILNQATILKSGEDVKHPKERIRHIGRAFQELGLIEIEDQDYSLTELGFAYFQQLDQQDMWQLTEAQAKLLRGYLHESASDSRASELIQVINQAITIARELHTFSFSDFNARFIQSMNLTEQWGAVTQDNRTKFMLNWLEELRYVEKTIQIYRYVEDEEAEVVDPMTVPERLELIKTYIVQRGFSYPDGLIENFYLSLKTKPFVILAGVSGTGKTKLVKLFAEAIGATTSNGQYALIPVRPDWSDPSDLLGYKDLSGAFRPGRLAEVLCDARKRENRNKPYIICLDEMNLARVEHYFSDLLSILETQEWRDGAIVTAPIIHRAQLASEDDRNTYGDLSIPDNVYFVGTVNMDETTHPFSKKVLDRANTIEFNYINLSQFPDEGTTDSTPLISAPNSFLRSEYLQLADAYVESEAIIKRVTERLMKMNNILESIHAHVGFRIRDAICFYLIYSQRDQLLTEEEAFDIQLLQKILPRIQGSSSSVKRVLLKLLNESVEGTLAIQEYMDDASSLYGDNTVSGPLSRTKYPQSARKITFMLRRLEEDGFTSYWLS